MGSARGWLVAGGTSEETPANPPDLAPGKNWRFFGRQAYEGTVVENRKFGMDECSDDAVVVLREGFAFPTRELLRVVNGAHAVLVLRGGTEYFYLRNDFVMSAREEDALVEWGVGRPLFANSLVAVGGTLWVSFVENVWGPGLVGILLVAAAGYRVQGVLTKVLRIRSDDWKSKHKLLPSGIHGTERLVQGLLVTLVALADLLDNRRLLLVTLTLASAQVLLLEYEGQARLTWGRDKHGIVLSVQLLLWTGYCGVVGSFLWLSYALAGFFGVLLPCFLFVLLLQALSRCAASFISLDDGRWSNELVYKYVIPGGVLGVGVWAAVLGWDDADLKFSPQSLQPWLWPLLRAPDSFSTSVRVVGLWVGVLAGCYFAVCAVVGVLSFRISNDADKVVGVGERTRERQQEESRGFSHYHVSSIPSRNILLPDGGHEVWGVGEQSQPAPVAYVV
eukprot:g13675.t1